MSPQGRDDEQYFHAEVELLIHNDGVTWVGAVDHPRKVERLRNAAALIHGTPVVASRVGSVSEVVDEGVTGYHAESLDEPRETRPVPDPRLSASRRRVPR